MSKLFSKHSEAETCFSSIKTLSNIKITPKNFKVDCETGELKLFLVTTNSNNAISERLGPKLSDPDYKDLLEKIKQQSPGFQTKSPINGGCYAYSKPDY